MNLWKGSKCYKNMVTYATVKSEIRAKKPIERSTIHSP